MRGSNLNRRVFIVVVAVVVVALARLSTQQSPNQLHSQSFSSVVGPNGSGKSNVIDALLFVFGKRAKQVRRNRKREERERERREGREERERVRSRGLFFFPVCLRPPPLKTETKRSQTFVFLTVTPTPPCSSSRLFL